MIRKFKCFELEGYTAQTAVWEITTTNPDRPWVTSQWAGTEKENKVQMYPCAATGESRPELAKGLWMMDIGCGHDLVNKAMAEGYPTVRLSHPITVSTANGKVQAYRNVPMAS